MGYPYNYKQKQKLKKNSDSAKEVNLSVTDEIRLSVDPKKIRILIANYPKYSIYIKEWSAKGEEGLMVEVCNKDGDLVDDRLFEYSDLKELDKEQNG